MCEFGTQKIVQEKIPWGLCLICLKSLCSHTSYSKHQHKLCLKAACHICLQWLENTLVWDENKYFKQKYPEIGNLEKGGIGECKGEERTFLLCSNMPMLENI